MPAKRASRGFAIADRMGPRTPHPERRPLAVAFVRLTIARHLRTGRRRDTRPRQTLVPEATLPGPRLSEAKPFTASAGNAAPEKAPARAPSSARSAEP